MQAWINDFVADFHLNFIQAKRWKYLLDGLGATLEITLLSGILGIIIGIIIAMIRSTYDKTADGARKTFGRRLFGLLDGICRVYLTVLRGTPVVVQLMIIYFVIFASSDNGVMVASLAFGLNSGAYVAEIVRGGIMSIDKGQMEAGRSLGLNYIQTMWHIIIPQAIKNILPALGNEFITLLKETSIVNVIGAKDITKWAMNVQGRTYQAFMPFIGIAVVYLIMVIILSKLVSMLERRLNTDER